MPFKPVDQAIKVILGPCIDDSDFKSREEALTYDQAGMEIDVILEKHDGTVTTTAVTPTEAGAGVYDWAHTDQGYYELELPASGGGDYNNDTEGALTVVGYCTGVLPFKSVTYDIVPEKVWNSLVEGSDNLEVDAIAISASATAANNVESVFTGAGDTGDVDLVARSLKLNNDADVALEILSSDDSAIKAVSSASGKHGMELAGNVAGDGLNATGVSTGSGIHAIGGSTSGEGIEAEAATEGDGIRALAKGTTQHGIYATGGDTSGDGIKAEAATDGQGLNLVGANAGNGLLATGAGAGHGISGAGGATGTGATFAGGATSGAGFRAYAQNNNDAGMDLDKHGTGKDLDAGEIDTIDSNVDSILADTGTDGVLLAADQEVDVAKISTSATAANNLEAVLLGTGDTADVDLVARSLKLNNDADVALEVLSSNDSAIKAVSSASGKHGMELAGNVAGNGLIATGGSTGAGLKAVGGSSSGAGIYANASANNDAGMELVKHGTGKDLDAGWNSEWDAEVQSECADALTAYDPPTKGEMDTAHALLATPAQVATALTNYDGPTKAEMDAGHALLATPAQVATALTNYDAPTKAEMDTAHALLATPAQVNAQVLDVLNTDTFGESASIPAATSTLIDKIKFLFTLARNKMTQTATTTTLYADNGSTAVGTSTVSDDGTTFTRGEYS